MNMQPATAVEGRSEADTKMHAHLGNLPPRLARALIGLGREMGHIWAMDLRSTPATSPIRVSEWVAAHELHEARGSEVAPFPLVYSDKTQRVHWTVERSVRPGSTSAVLRVEITRQWPTVATLQKALYAATNERDEAGPNLSEDASGAAYDALKAAQDGLQAALMSPALRRGQTVCSVLLHEDGRATWGTTDLRAEGRHWRRLVRLIVAAGYSMPTDAHLHKPLVTALVAMNTYDDLCAAARQAGYDVPTPHSDSLYAWELWGLKYGCSTTAITSWIAEQVEALGGTQPPPAVLKLWYTTYRGDDCQLPGILRSQQQAKPSAPRLPSVNPALS
mgnify:FL=1